MVDLGFLLITFFVFTSQISKPKALDLVMPKDEGESTPTKCSTSFTVLADGDKLGWYQCEDGAPAGFRTVAASALAQIRTAIVQRRNDVMTNTGVASDMVILIKPLADCNYQTLVNVLDEMTINGVTRYAIVEPDDSDRKMMGGTRH